MSLGRPTVRSLNGMVSAGHPLATEAGLSMLRAGGTAADAAVAASAVCTVVLPQRTGIGGDLFALVHDARTGRVHALNGSGCAPASCDPDRFSAGFPTHGASIATVPGLVAAWGDLMAAHGRLGLEQALAPAIDLADRGFPIGEKLARAIVEQAPRLRADPEARRVFRVDDPPRAGTVMRFPELAASLGSIARAGASDFYTGGLAERLVQGIGVSGGLIGGDDLAAHATDRPEPLEVAYRGLRVYGQPPVSQGHILLEALAIAETLPISALGRGSAELIDRMARITRLGFADRDRFAGDPRFVDFDARRLLDPAFVRSRAVDVGGLAAATSDDTTFLAVADAEGNAVSLILSVFSAFGCAVVVPGTGVVLNNRLTGFNLDPASPNCLAPRKRPVHSLNAVLVLEDGRPRYVFGTPGRHAQVQTNFQLAVALIDFGEDVQAAIEAPRWYHDGSRLQLESRFSTDTVERLRVLGHEVGLLGDWSEITGGAQVIARGADGALAGGADPRREGFALGY